MLHARMLRYLDEVVRCGSIRAAAERLHVASSSINRQIIELEDELGTPLFERLPRRLRLTSAGEVLIAHVRQTLRDHERARFRILELKGVGRGTVRLATMNGPAGGVFPKLCRDFTLAYPGIKFQVRNLTAPEIVAAVDEGDVDFGLGYNLPSNANLQAIDVFNARLGAVVAPNHPLASQAGIRLSDCVPYPIVRATENLTIRGLIDRASKLADVTLRAVCETNSIEMMKFIISTGEAISFLSAPDVADDVRDGKLVFLPFSDRGLATNPLTLIQRSRATASPSTALFIEALRARLREIIG